MKWKAEALHENAPCNQRAVLRQDGAAVGHGPCPCGMSFALTERACSNSVCYHGLVHFLVVCFQLLGP